MSNKVKIDGAKDEDKVQQKRVREATNKNHWLKKIILRRRSRSKLKRENWRGSIPIRSVKEYSIIQNKSEVDKKLDRMQIQPFVDRCVWFKKEKTIYQKQ